VRIERALSSTREVAPSGATTTQQYELCSGRRILLAPIDALGNDWTYTYDTLGRMATVTPGNAGVPTGSFTYAYLLWERSQRN
jgi:YD repeat-containing protein